MNKKSVFSLLVLLTTLLTLISPADATPPTPAELLSVEEGVSRAVDSLGSAAPTAPLACPAGCGLPDSIESSDGFPFCVYYDSGDTTLSQAQDVRDYTDDYWDVYENDYGWAMPTEFVGGKFKVCLVDSGTTCNGSVFVGTDSMTVFEGCDSTVEMMMAVVGHELAHAGPQLGPNNLTVPNFDALWAHEGMARSGEDKVFDAVDNDAGAMARPFSYNKEVDEFFVNPNHDLTADSWRYESAIWWTYYAEQCGSDPVNEPGLGVADSFGEFWDEAHTSDNIAALNIALSTLGCPQFDTMVPKFVLANYTKDLTGLPDASYYYIDETNPGNPDTYGPLVPNDGGTIDSGTTATWNNQAISRYGADYYVAAPDPADCPVITAKFHNDDPPNGPAFYHIVTSNSGAFNTHLQGSGTDWVRSFLNDGVTTIAAIAGSLGSSSQVDIELSCPDPTLYIQQPNQMAPEYVGGHADGDKFLIQVVVSDTVGGPVVGGLTVNDFAVRVGAHNATIVGGGQVEHQYFLQVVAPDPGTNGPYDLHVDLEESGTSTVIASDTEIEAVVYDATNEDNVYVVDRSGSMGWYDPTPWSALVDAFKLAVDTTNSSEGIAVVPFNQDVNPAASGMQFATLPVRTAAKTYIDGITPGGGTSIGDGMAEGAAQRVGSPTGNARCRYVLLSDGEQNRPAYWADVVAAVQATGCPVMSIAFGPGANETLMQQIATDTGGSYYYNDVYMGTTAASGVSSFSAADMVLDLGSIYQHAQARGERQRLLTEKGEADYRQTYTHTVQVDPSVLTADFILDWYSPYYAEMALALVEPNGAIISGTYDFDDTSAGHVGWRIPNPQDGEWKLLVRLLKSEVQPVDYQVMVTAKTNLTARLILPTLRRQFMTGNAVPIYALVTSGLGPVSNTLVLANVTAPDGMTQTVPLQHTGGGLFRGYYTLGNQANEVNPPAEDGFPDPEPNDEGSYRVDLLVNGQDGIHRESQGAFSILEAEDTNSNGLPDTWEDEHGVTNPSGDPDMDLLDNSDEYYAGTDPNNSDSDGGGEHDGSEVSHGQDPLDPADDEIEAPDFFQADPVTGGDVVLTYDVKVEYAKMSLYRASSTWALIVPELPLTGLYTDTTTVLGNSYAYRLVAIDGGNHWSRVLDSEVVTSSLDPVPPEALVIVNRGALTTVNLGVTLSFAALPDDWGAEAFTDIVEMKISNDPSLAEADWRAFAQDVSWTLEASSGELVQVYVLFKDASDNESVGPAIGSIYWAAQKIYLPLVLRNAP